MKLKTTVGIIGGTGLYELEGLSDKEQIEVTTPYGAPSSPITRGRLGDVEALFIARHGTAHTILPSEINFCANIFALKLLGASWCISVSAVGSLQEEHRPGDIVLPKQFIDRTKTRSNTLYGNGIAVHVPFADPVCPTAHSLLAETCKELSLGSGSDRRIATDGTYVCMEGPVFSTRAESHWYRSMGASIIGMTALPEAKLAREAELSYAVLATVTDYDCWRSETADIDVAELLATMASNSGFAKEVLAKLLPKLAVTAQPPQIANVLAASIITAPENIPASRKKELQPLLGKYLPA